MTNNFRTNNAMTSHVATSHVTTNDISKSTTLRVAVVGQNGVNRAAKAMRRQFPSGESERGEGVISAAIAVLIFALIGGAMWVAYRKLFQTSSENTAKVIDDMVASAK